MPTARHDDNAKASFAVFSSIRHELTAIIMGVSAAALVLSGIMIVLSEMAIFRKNMADDHALQTQMVANNCLAAVSFDDPDDASLVLRTLSSYPSLAYASVSKSDGEVLASYRRRGFSDEPQPAPASGEHLFTAKWMLSQEPIVLNGQTIGTAFLQSDLSLLANFQRQIVAIVAISLLAVFLIAWVASFRLQKIISEPIERLTRMVRDISRRRDYSIRAANVGGDEIGVLARAFNEMLSEVELRDEKLREREQRTQEYLDVARVMIVALDSDGVVTLINPKGCKILGRDEKDIVGKHWFDNFVPERLRESTKKAFGALLRGELATTEYFESEVITRSGEERLIAWSNSVIRDKAGTVTSTLSSGEDITDRRLAEEREAALGEQLARAERMESIALLAGGVAHDLNNMLGPMVMLPELIEDDLNAATQLNPETRAGMLESLDIMKVSANRASSVVQNLLALSRRGHYERVPTNINAMSCLTPDSSCIRSLRESHPDVEIDLHTSSDALTVLASENHLCRLVDNLIRNAAEAIDGKGAITITTSKRHLAEASHGYTTVPPGDYAIIEVTDTGHGIEQDHLSRIFEPFYTKKSKSARSGSGLGLSVVHGIADDHDGYIDVESKVGRGTTFALYFPLTHLVDNPTAPDESPVVEGKGRILVVDDEPGQRFLASKCLSRWGYTVGAAEDGRSAVLLFSEAKARNQEAPYDLIVLDMVMEPDFDGLDTFQEIRALYPEQKVLIASGHAEDDRSSVAVELGARWLVKPYSLTSMATAVTELLQAGKA